MDLLEKLKLIANERGTTLTAFERELGFGNNSIKRWNKSSPSIDKVIKLANYLNISLDWLLLDTPTSSSVLSASDEQILSLYKAADPNDQQKVKNYLEIATYALGNEITQHVNNINFNTKATRVIQYYQKLASAGTGEVIFQDMTVDRILIPDISKYKRVSYAIGVNGHSMEPLYNDGDMLLVEPICQIEIGEIGIFIIEDKAYVKKLGEEELISLNKGYNNIPLTNDTKCMGRVVDKINENSATKTVK
ncbi:MAG: helix-turn-helix domain-containing protein [Lachnospiraceae bacterium]